MESIKKKFLERLCIDNKHVSVYLINGIHLKGTLAEYDDEGILFYGNGLKQFIFNHAISTIQEVR